MALATAGILTKSLAEPQTKTAFLVLDTESVPDGRLLSMVKYPGEALSPAEAVQKAQHEARQISRDGSDFVPVSFQYPIAICVIRVGPEFELLGLTCLDAPLFRPREIVSLFWRGLARYNRSKLVSFNGRGFDLPLLELAAFRYGCSARDYFQSSRNRFQGNHVDLMEWVTNFGACRMTGGLNLLAKMLGKPGKMDVSGDQVYAMYLEGKIQQINEYCMFDTLDTYFAFLRSRVVTGDITLNQERDLVVRAKQWLIEKIADAPALQTYLDCWSDWQPWP